MKSGVFVMACRTPQELPLTLDSRPWHQGPSHLGTDCCGQALSTPHPLLSSSSPCHSPHTELLRLRTLPWPGPSKGPTLTCRLLFHDTECGLYHS